MKHRSAVGTDWDSRARCTKRIWADTCGADCPRHHAADYALHSARHRARREDEPILQWVDHLKEWAERNGIPVIRHADIHKGITYHREPLDRPHRKDHP